MYSPTQLRYIASVGGNAHQSALEIIAALEAVIANLEFKLQLGSTKAATEDTEPADTEVKSTRNK